MSLLFAGGVALTYATGVVGLHRYNVWRLRRAAGFYPTLRWHDWDTLLAGLVPPATTPCDPARPPEGGPGPECLETTDEATASKRALLAAVVSGASVDQQAFESTGFSGGEARWLGLLTQLRTNGVGLLGKLEGVEPATAAEAYLREALTLDLLTTPVNLELAVFSSKRRITNALARFGEQAALYFARAKASAMLGFNTAVLDDLGRAVYFSRQSRFYAKVVSDWAYAEETRPALWKASQSELLRDKALPPERKAE